MVCDSDGLASSRGMSKMRVLHLVVILSALTLVVGCVAPQTTERRQSSFNKRDLVTSGVNVLPTESVVKTTSLFGGNEQRMYEYEEYIENIITDEVRSAFKEKGYQVDVLSKGYLHQEKLSAQFLRLKENYASKMPELYSQYLMPVEAAFSIKSNIGQSTIKFAEGKKYLVICDYQMSSQTNGARVSGIALQVLTGIRFTDQSDTFSMTIGIVDNETGDIVWTNTTNIAYGMFNGLMITTNANAEEADRKHIKWIVGKILEPLFNTKEQ
ncbi:hypothetical protein EDM53_04055 [Rickettsiales endosymbiont of Peranema trichophorum]|uniref:hypothetical protein n=1 Tax=Rickettsiales endosymbiont of Peranema trichophorum TaxID=2486577 RepID=UPI001022DE24|nr:hypothetical protein [Rickettsiales endosymbiont of Peranema trichophorum]RZI46308.1 hypothetical protein EDM53_04055 [Rickettsiales endosymbiont of Peranema trichophorum]